MNECIKITKEINKIKMQINYKTENLLIGFQKCITYLKYIWTSVSKKSRPFFITYL